MWVELSAHCRIPESALVYLNWRTKLSNRTIRIPLKDGDISPPAEQLAQAKHAVESEVAGLPPAPLWVHIGNSAVSFSNGALVLGRVATDDPGINPPWFTLLGFCIELHLKFFIAANYPEATTTRQLQASGQKIRGHVYPQLYDLINDKFKPIIAECYSKRVRKSIDAAGFRDALVAVGDSPFIVWRYVFEYAEGGVFHQDANPLFHLADALAEAGRATFKELSARHAERYQRK
jgi:hypothetical protein